ncbi:MAG: CPBP family intramembrane glutamic endopeptidase [Chthoniobacterales bacterium]
MPVVIAFQLFIHRQPLRTLWVRNSPRFHLDALGVLFALLLMISPAYELVTTAARAPLMIKLYLVCSLVGAVGVAFALRHIRAALSGRALWPFGAALLVGTLTFALWAVSHGRSASIPANKLLPFLKIFLGYLVVSFVIEEVAFRGAFDSHVYQPIEGRRHEWLSAVFISALWGIWHLPLVPLHGIAELVVVVPIIVLSHCLDGVFISLCWRRSGTLLLPSVYHSLIDAYRNILNG